MTSRHLTAARLHGDLPPGSVRPGMSRWHLVIGALVHECAGALAVHRMASPQKLAGLATEWANEHAKDTKVLGNLAKARTQITSSTVAYLMRFAPDDDTQHLGSEISFDGGRIDLAWFVPDLGVVIDELKTTAWVRLDVDASMLEQPRKYRKFGLSEWGEQFAGVRFVPLRNPAEARFLAANGDVHRLVDSAAAGMAMGKR